MFLKIRIDVYSLKLKIRKDDGETDWAGSKNWFGQMCSVVWIQHYSVVTLFEVSWQCKAFMALLSLTENSVWQSEKFGRQIT